MIVGNQRELSKNSNTGVCGLLVYYLQYCINPDEIEENEKLEFGSFYEIREREYGLSWFLVILMNIYQPID